MNKIVIGAKGNYVLVCEDGSQFDCTVITEKRTQKDYIKLPANNPSGRQFIAVTFMDNKAEYEFATKTEHRTGLGNGGWRAKLTEEEKQELVECEARIEAIKQAAMNREVQKVDKNSKEGIEAQIAKLQERLNKMRVGE